jgi:hypothetical protein
MTHLCPDSDLTQERGVCGHTREKQICRTCRHCRYSHSTRQMKNIVSLCLHVNLNLGPSCAVCLRCPPRQCLSQVASSFVSHHRIVVCARYDGRCWQCGGRQGGREGGRVGGWEGGREGGREGGTVGGWVGERVSGCERAFNTPWLGRSWDQSTCASSPRQWRQPLLPQLLSRFRRIREPCSSNGRRSKGHRPASSACYYERSDF